MVFYIYYNLLLAYLYEHLTEPHYSKGTAGALLTTDTMHDHRSSFGKCVVLNS